MASNRRLVLAGVAVAIGLLTAFILLDVFATVFFAMTVAYVFAPAYHWFRHRGLPPWWASAATTALTFVGGLAIFLPVVLVLYLRRGALLGVISDLPNTFSITLFGTTTTVTIEQLTTLAISYLQGLAVTVARVAPALAVKVGLFGLVLFALFLGGHRARSAAFAVVPVEYHDVATALLQRARATLFAIYVLQALTAIATFLIAIPVFYALNYDYPFAMATIAAILQFLPIIGPSLVVGVAAAYHLAVGEFVRAVLVVLVAGVLVAWLPDMLIRPRFARRTADLPGSLYFVGFTGGLFSLGPIGVIAGPLVVALFVESVSLLGDELNHVQDSPLAEELGVEGTAEGGPDRESPDRDDDPPLGGDGPDEEDGPREPDPPSTD